MVDPAAERAVRVVVTERWRPVVGYEGRYEVSDCGRVRSVGRTFMRRNSPVRVRGRLRPGATVSGHVTVALCREGKQRSEYVHRLVMRAFVGACPDGLEVRHGDGIPDNNMLGNLTYGTRSANIYDAVRHNTHHQSSKTHCPQGHPYSESNTYRWRRTRRCVTCMTALSRVAA